MTTRKFMPYQKKKTQTRSFFQKENTQKYKDAARVEAKKKADDAIPVTCHVTEERAENSYSGSSFSWGSICMVGVTFISVLIASSTFVAKSCASFKFISCGSLIWSVNSMWSP
jgi:hypothetical protein